MPKGSVKSKNKKGVKKKAKIDKRRGEKGREGKREEMVRIGNKEMRWRGTPSKEGTHLVIVQFGIGLKGLHDKLRVFVRSLIRHKEIIHGQAIQQTHLIRRRKEKTPEGAKLRSLQSGE